MLKANKAQRQQPGVQGQCPGGDSYPDKVIFNVYCAIIEPRLWKIVLGNSKKNHEWWAAPPGGAHCSYMYNPACTYIYILRLHVHPTSTMYTVIKTLIHICKAFKQFLLLYLFIWIIISSFSLCSLPVHTGMDKQECQISEEGALLLPRWGGPRHLQG